MLIDERLNVNSRASTHFFSFSGFCCRSMQTPPAGRVVDWIGQCLISVVIDSGFRLRSKGQAALPDFDSPRLNTSGLLNIRFAGLPLILSERPYLSFQRRRKTDWLVHFTSRHRAAEADLCGNIFGQQGRQLGEQMAVLREAIPYWSVTGTTTCHAKL